MKQLLLAISLLPIFQNLIIAQPILFQNEAVDTIIIQGAEHHYAYGAAQTNKKDKLTIAYSKRTKNYKILNYEREIAKYPANHGYPKIIKKSKPTFISKRKLQSNLNLLIENIDTSIFPVKITDYYERREIQRKITFWKVLKVYRNSRDIEDFMDIEIAYDYYKSCKKIADLDSLINEIFKYALFITHSNSLLIKIKTASKNHVVMNASQTLGQPFTERNYANIVNININIALTEILPKGFIERNILLLDNLVEYYIKWHIDNYKLY